MRKPQIQPSLASLTLAEREQLADWLRHGEYHDVLARVNQPRPEGFGLAIASIKPLWTFHAKVALFDLINARQPESKKLSFATFETLARRDIELLTSAENESLAEAHASILSTVADLAKSGGNSTTQLLHLQRLADFPARVELREHKIQMDLARKDFAQQRLEIQKRHLAIAEKLAEKKLAASSPSPLGGDHDSRSERLVRGNTLVAGSGSHWAGVRGDSAHQVQNVEPSRACDHLGPLATNWEDVRKRAQKAFGITPEESARRAELRRTWVDPNAHRNTPAPTTDSELGADHSCEPPNSPASSQADVASETPATVLPFTEVSGSASAHGPSTPIPPIPPIIPITLIPETTNPSTPAPLTRDQRLAEFYKGMAAQAAETLKTLNARRANANAENQNENQKENETTDPKYSPLTPNP